MNDLNAGPALERFERAAMELRDAASSLGGAHVTGMDAVDRLGVAVAAVHAALDIVRQISEGGDAIYDE